MIPATPARCRHFGTCGGCATQDLPYEQQLRRKSDALGALFAPFTAAPIPVLPSPEVWYYRNKMEFSFGRLGHKELLDGPDRNGRRPYRFILEDTVLGFKEKGRWDRTLDLQECFLLSPRAPRLLAAVRAWAAAEGLEGWDQKSDQGFLRHLVVREGKNTGQSLVLLLTRQGPFPAASFVEAVASAYPEATVLRGENGGVSDVARAERLDILSGPGWIEEVLNLGRPLRLRVSPFSFFQTNTRGAERLYTLIRELAGPRPGVVVDLYGGSGGIAFALADRAQSVLCVESNPSAVEDGRHNAALNGIANVEFVPALSEAYLASRTLSSELDLLVADPPRNGLHPKALKALLELLPPRLIYVACNPKALARDLESLRTAYALKRLEAVDLFPHTEHVEAVALLEKT